MNKQHILDEIRRTARENGGEPLGVDRFCAATGIARSDIYGRYWRHYGEAVKEAGYKPNQLQAAYDEKDVIAKLAAFVCASGHYPVGAELRMKAREDPDFPSRTVFLRIGRKHELAAKVIAYCEAKGGLDDVVAICRPIAASPQKTPEVRGTPEAEFEFVYLMKSGKYYRIGKSNSVGRRRYEHSLRLPEPIKVIHKFKTDDPLGIEAYWHKRFAQKRVRGDWFNLSAADVVAFKKRKFFM